MSTPRLLRPLALLPVLLVAGGCEDAALRDLERRATVRMIEARAILGSRDAFAREHELIKQERARLLAAFEATGAGALSQLIERAGGEVEARTGRTVRFHVAAPAAAREMLGTDGDRRAVSIESILCADDGCAGELFAIPPPPAKAAPREPTLADLPPRPLWPAERSRWARTKASLEELQGLCATLGPLCDVKASLEELYALREAIDAPQRRAELLLLIAQDALESGAVEVLAAGFGYDEGYGVRGIARGTSAPFQDRLAQRGKASRDGEGFEVKVELPTLVALRKLTSAARR